ncbi:DMT family transporter [Clostridium luticellarii]|jgi:drug/metabolite transporter (DMT)-like permease|uniref:DMT family transporter n=1 Tax=Clostridium luticellarii TaxID=1691940 RepID=UPI002353EB68|nr:DMT family transporter [Clostridium luticellarii]MCI1946081.1 DMT family transporter [Clostridium luticellarii]MCI1967513.1 DMT family transporter [Clostridium luticellarii]MCI1996444.1 DMT family transporter [Clostridium luticellarii]MCI2040797.1 DMT family transporter [Clostridium luticellarii]
MKDKPILKLNLRTKGILLVITASMLWGVSGPIAQYLFKYRNISSEWLTDIRLLASGIIFLTVLYFKNGKKIFDIWKSKYGRRHMVLFSIFGLIGTQFGYFQCINYSNAPTATILQYLNPVIIVLYFAIYTKKFPTSREYIAIVLALLGTFFIVTKGDIHSLAISNQALFWGILSAFAAAFYVVQPFYIIKKWGCDIVVGWGMFLGGLAFSFVHTAWKIQGKYNFSSILGIIFIIVFGTLLAFYWYSSSTKYIKASETALLSCIEPLSATVISIAWLNISFGIFDIIGGICIISTVIILSYSTNKDVKA